jgi:glycosyltransferase involved in cell wall biosynthesis
MSRPLITIITPSFNQIRYINATLQSILYQDYDNFEILVMDGGSTDGTLDMLNSITDSRLQWISEIDNGQSDALNKGLRQSRGELITYLNSDDLLRDGALSAIVQHFTSQLACDVVYGDCDLIDQRGAKIGLLHGLPFSLQGMLTGSMNIAQPGTVWRRKVYDRVGEFDRSLHYCMDLDYWIRCALAGFQLDYLEGGRSAFRLHDSSKSVSASEKFWNDRLMLINKVYGALNLPPEIRQTEEVARAYIQWHTTKIAWDRKDYQAARPSLRSFLSSKRIGRRILAALMLIDSYLSTPLTRWAWAIYGMLRKPTDSFVG